MSDQVAYARIKALFHQALAVPASERVDWLAAACGDDDALRAEVESLLAADPGSDPTFLSPRRPCAPIDPATLGLDRGWRVIRELARGGMGVVFLAERADGAYDQQVALKLLPPRSAADAEAAMQLKFERQILAGLRHPNIARLIDGGTTATGTPYLVMEYVPGERIDRWCAQHALDTEAMLRLFLKVCDAVAHAHRNLIVHRDLKPANVLVGEDGEPKLLDFGIARLQQADSTLTASGERMMTPRYASPEQVRGEPVSTLSDVYSLGVLLYELLTGISPYGQLADAPQRLSLAICDTEPSRPSDSISGPRRRASGAPPAVLPRHLRGDLDAIVLRCLRKAPADRYASVEALTADLQAHLAGLPVVARRGERWYRMRRFSQRHWRLLATAAGVLLLCIGFVLQLAIQLDRTRAERERALAAEVRAQVAARNAERARDFLVSLFAAAAPAQTLGEPISPRQLLDRAREQVLQGLDDAPELAASTWLALASTYAALGDPVASEEAAAAALAQLPDGADGASRLRADALEARGMALVRLGRFGEGRPLLQQMLALREHAFADDPALLARSYANLGHAAKLSGEFVDALDWLQRARALQQSAPDHPGADVEHTSILASIVSVAASAGEIELGQDHLDQADAIAARLDPRSPVRVDLLVAAAALDRRQGDHELSLQRLLEAEALSERVSGLQTETLAVIHNELGVSYNGLGRYAEALDHLQRAHIAYAGLDEAQADVDANIGAIHESLEDYGRAIFHARRALAVMQRDPVGNRPAIRQVRTNLAQALSFDGQHDEALALIRQVIADSVEHGGVDGFHHVLARFRHAGMLRRAGQIDAARAELGASTPPLLALLGDPEHPFNFYPIRLAATIDQSDGELDAAREGLRQAIAFAERHPGADPVAVAMARMDLAELLAEADPAEATALLAAAREVLDQALPAGAPSRREADELARRLRGRTTDE
jgi:eukaryotic-like serine/threonine-protein kinase